MKEDENTKKWFDKLVNREFINCQCPYCQYTEYNGWWDFKMDKISMSSLRIHFKCPECKERGIIWMVFDVDSNPIEWYKQKE